MTELQITPNSMADTIERYQLEAINSFAVFQFNYDHNFIQIAFKDGMTDHLQQKFTGIYNQYGSKAAIIMKQRIAATRLRIASIKMAIESTKKLLNK